MIVGEVNLSGEVTQEQVDDLLCAALEGGSNYWIERIKSVDYKGGDFASDAPSRGGSFVVVTEDGDFKVTLREVLKGIELACKHYGVTPEGLYENHDADTGDCVLQFAIFGELLYG